jgi:sulfite exporter TauE/SafE
MSDVSILFVVGAGLVAGALHVLSGPDHLAAVAPLAADSRSGRWHAGFSWGIGHTGGVLVVGLLAVLLRGLLPLDSISSWSERLVGVALIAVGLWSGHRLFRARVHAHRHEHDGVPHSHVHFHGAGARGHSAAPAVEHRHAHASFGFGVLHGLAGSSHVLGILPALAFPTREAGVLYLLSYGVGTVAAMTAFSSAIGFMATRARFGGARVYQGLLAACSLAAIGVGTFWLLA